MLTRVVVGRIRENGLTGRKSNECKLRATCWRILICDELPFYAAQLACLLHKVVEANKKVEMQECRRWKPWGEMWREF